MRCKHHSDEAREQIVAAKRKFWAEKRVAKAVKAVDLQSLLR
jgi:hypothetical protein